MIRSLLYQLNHAPIWRWRLRVWGQRVRATSLDRLVYLVLHRVGLMGTEEARLLKKLIQPGMRILDVGANIGLYTLDCARLTGPSGRVFAFEPEPNLFSALQENCAANHAVNVIPFQCAAGAVNGRAILQRGTFNSGDNRLGPAKADGQSIEMEIARLDEVLLVPTVDFIKIDVQGHELAALSGMEQLIALSPDVKVLFEFGPAGLRAANTSPESLLDFFRERGFHLYEVKDARPRRILDSDQLLAGLRGNQYTNLLAARDVLEQLPEKPQVRIEEELEARKPRWSWFRFFWFCALGTSFLVSAFAAARGGFVGPDYNLHFWRLTSMPKLLDFSTTDPPVYYLLGRGLFRLIGPTNAFPITLSILQAALNTAALWWFCLFSERRFRSPILHLALVFFLAFLPVRVIHSVTIGTDCLVVPSFVLILFLVDKFLSAATSTFRNATLLGLALTLGILGKYSFMSLLPAVLLIFVFMWWKWRWTLQRFVGICALALVLPSGVVLYNFWASSHGSGYSTNTLWRGKGMGSDMSHKELFTVKRTDLQLYQAPEYFKREIMTAFKYSYLGLSHFGVFTDPMNLFQVFKLPPHLDGTLIPDYKTRLPWKTTVMRASMMLGTLWTFLALLGTAWLFFRALNHLFREKLRREDAAILLGIAYFLLMFLPLPYVHAALLFGYWTPRLILPALFCFFWAGFLLLDRKAGGGSAGIAIVVLTLVVIQCGIEITMLI
jgi:FkbM family methyltransferase